MSLDNADFNTTVTRQQHGFQPSFFSIVIDATQLATGQEILVNANPCDHIWLPTYFDPSLGFNPQQAICTSGTPSIGTSNVSSGPNQNRASQTAGIQPNQGVGMNFFDEWDQEGDEFFQAATIFSLRFNSVNAPWLLWGLSSLQSSDFATAGTLIGQGDCMRSITGPISRIWFKKLFPAIVARNANAAADRIVLLASLGFSQVTLGQNSGPFNITTPTQPPMSAYAVSGGGYQTTQVNTLERLKLDQMGIGQAGALREK